MERDVRVLLVALFYDLLIFLISLIAFLYIRHLRGDHREREIVRSARGFQSARTTENDHHTIKSVKKSCEGSRNKIKNGSLQYMGLGGWRISTSLPEANEVEFGTHSRTPALKQSTSDESSEHLTSSFHQNLKLNNKFNRNASRIQIVAVPRHSYTGRKGRSQYKHPRFTSSSLSVCPPSDDDPILTSRYYTKCHMPVGTTFVNDNPREAPGQEDMFSWLKTLWMMEDKRFQSTDIQFYLVFLKTCRSITFWNSLAALFIILPTNLSAPMKSNAEGWLDRAAAENITEKDWKIWILMISTWIYVFICYFYIGRFWMEICNPHLLSNGVGFNAEAYTVMIKGLSRNITDPAILFDHFERLFPNKVVCANIILDFSELLSAKRALQDTLSRLYRAETIQSHRLVSPSPRPIEASPDLVREIIRPSLLSESIIDRMTSNHHYSITLQQDRNQPFLVIQLPSQSIHEEEDVNYWKSLVEVRSMAVDDVLAKPPSKNAGVGFVSFRDAMCIAQCTEDPRVAMPHYEWQLCLAPPPKDIIWFNIHISKTNRKIRAFVLNLLLVILSIVLTSSAMLTNALLPLAENVEKAFNDADFFKLSVTGWGAPLLLFLVNSVCLPQLIQWTANSTGYWRLSDIASSILHGNVLFLVLNTVIFPTIGNGSIGALIARMYNTQIQEWNVSLSRLIIGQSGSFAIRYLLNGCFLSSAAQLLQLGQLSWFGVLQTLGKDAERWSFDFGYSYAFCISILCMVMSFGIVVPLVLPFGCLFFVLKYYVDKYNFLFGVWKVEEESAGAVAAIAVKYCLGVVAFLQFVMSGYFVTFGLRATRNMKPATTTSIPTGKGLVLGGTFLLVVSLVSTVLLLGHSAANIATPRRVHSTVTETELTAKQEDFLCQSYIHPYEYEMEERMLLLQRRRRVANLIPHKTACFRH